MFPVAGKKLKCEFGHNVIMNYHEMQSNDF